MERDEQRGEDAEPHVFDQTNGVVDLGDASAPVERREARDVDRAVGGLAMLSVQKP